MISEIIVLLLLSSLSALAIIVFVVANPLIALAKNSKSDGYSSDGSDNDKASDSSSTDKGCGGIITHTCLATIVSNDY